MNTMNKQSNGIYNIQLTHQQASKIWFLLLEDRNKWFEVEKKFFIEGKERPAELVEIFKDVEELLTKFLVPDPEEEA